MSNKTIGSGGAAAILICGLVVGLLAEPGWAQTNELVEPADVMARARALAYELLHCGPQGLALTKRYLADLIGQMSPGTKEGVRVSAEIRLGAEAAEGLRAFLEKRQPTWCPGT